MQLTTGLLVVVALLVVVGEQAHKMQLAHWISRSESPWLTNEIPAWGGMWFALFPTYETIIAQVVAAILVIGSYYGARQFHAVVPPPAPASVSEAALVEQLEASP